MGYTLFDYLASEQQRYRLSVFISISAILLGIIVITIGLLTNSNSLNSYRRYEGSAIKVEYTMIKKSSRLPFEINQLRDYKVLLIETSNKKFYIGDDFEPYWQKVFNQINQGDNIIVYYYVNKLNNNFVIRQLESNGQIIIPNSYKYSQGGGLMIYITVILFFAIVMLIGLISKRKSLNMKFW